MSSDPEFRVDLYRGTASFYDRFRVPYPAELLADLLRRAHVSGSGRLFDVACGTGQLTFALCDHFAEVWAVDQEPETVAFARAKATRVDVRNIRWIAGRAEDVTADGSFELVTIGNAFHRLQRHVVAESAFRWLAPGGHIALVWSGVPWLGAADWHGVMADAMERWTRTADATDRVPSGLAEAWSDEPHTTVLARAGFTTVGHFEFLAPHEWSVESLVGFMYSTSFLSREALGTHREAFEEDMRERLLSLEPTGVFREEISFGYDLAERP
jgi:ubiquinone/menaquinone biosynthesis C-methylase UbiE